MNVYGLTFFRPMFQPGRVSKAVDSFSHDADAGILHSAIARRDCTFLPSYLLTLLPCYLVTSLPSYPPTTLRANLPIVLSSYRPIVLPSYRPIVQPSNVPTFLRSYFFIPTSFFLPFSSYVLRLTFLPTFRPSYPLTVSSSHLISSSDLLTI